MSEESKVETTEGVIAVVEPATPVAPVQAAVLDISQPRPPFRLVGVTHPNSVLCARCKLPAGKLSILDSLHRIFLIKANTNFLKVGDDYVHENLSVCNVGKEVGKVPTTPSAAKTEQPSTSAPVDPQPQA